MYLKRPSKKVSNPLFLKTFFDINNIKSMWHCQEDKKFYEIQLSSLGGIGHSSITQVSLHSSEVRVFNSKDTTSTSKLNKSPVSCSITSEESCSDLDSQDNYEPLEMKISRKRVYNKTKLASKLVKLIH